MYYIKLLQIAGAVFVCCLSVVASANVNVSHPRIWLDKDTIARLETAYINNDSEWQALENFCGSHLAGTTSSGYQGEAWYKLVMSYGLSYQITKDERYGNAGVVYLKALLRDKLTVGDNQGGTTIFPDLISTGWHARTFGAGVATGRDWLDGSTALTQNIIDECGMRLSEWINWYNTSPTAYTGPSHPEGAIPEDNFYAGYFSMVYLSAIGLAGDTNYEPNWLTQAQAMWSLEILPVLNGILDGGDWVEGWNYGDWASREYLLFPQALMTGTTYPDHWNETDWNLDLIKGHIHMLYPSRAYFSDDGSWTGSTKGDPRASTVMMAASGPNVDSVTAGLAKWYARNITLANSQPQWEVFLWTDTSVVEVKPTAVNMGGLAYFINGRSRILARSAPWDDTKATFIDFAVPPSDGIAEGERNAGEFKFASRGELLIVDADTWQNSSDFSNVLSVNGTHTYAPNQEWWRDSSKIDRFEEGNGYVYARGVGLESAYDGKLATVPSLQSYKRELAFIHPDYLIVLDKAVPTNAVTNTITFNVHFACEPVINATNASCVNGNARVFAKFLAPAVQLTKTATTVRPNVWRLSATPNTTESGYTILSIYEAGGSEQTSMSSVEALTYSEMRGIHVSGDKTQFVALFASDPTGSDQVPTMSLELTPNSGTTYVYLFGVQPGSAYNVEITQNSGPDTVVVGISKGVEYTASEEGVLKFGVGYPVPDIKANSTDGTLSLIDNLLVTVALDPGSHSGVNADWWVVVNTPFGWFHYDVSSGSWIPGLIVTYQGPLFNLTPAYKVLSMTGIPVGIYTFYFGVDMVMNGSLDMGSIYYDSVDVTVAP